MTDLSGRDLDEALARAMGWTWEEVECDENFPHKGIWAWHSPWPDFEPCDAFPEYHESIDALLRDVWPECQRRGWEGWDLGTSFHGFSALIHAGDEGELATKCADTPATALARAMLAALQEGAA